MHETNKRSPAGRRGGGGRIYMSLIVTLFINASRRCRKLNENGNSLSLLEFYKWGVSDAL